MSTAPGWAWDRVRDHPPARWHNRYRQRAGAGARPITITLPLYKEQSCAGPARAGRGNGTAPHILVVEDEPLVREVIEVYLREDSHIIQTASTAAKAWKNTGPAHLTSSSRTAPCRK